MFFWLPRQGLAWNEGIWEAFTEEEAPGLGPEATLNLREGEGLERCGQTPGLESGR